jgi:peptidoglycan hydrolase CwlO-like protein
MEKITLNRRRILLSLLLVSIIWVTPSQANEVCFTEADASKIVVELEKGRICEQQVVQYEVSVKELSIQIESLKTQVETMSNKFDETMKQLETERKIASEKDKARLEEIKTAGKPQWTMLFGGFGAGALLIGALVLLL